MAPTFAKIFCSLRDHPKAVAAGDRAMWLYVCSILYSKERQTEGKLDSNVLQMLAPGTHNVKRLAQILEEFNLWERTTEGWEIHDYRDFQQSLEQESRAREKNAERQRRFRNAVSNGSVTPLDKSKSRGEVTKDVTSPSSSPSATRVAKELEKASKEDKANCRLFAELGRERNTKLKIPEDGSGEHATWLQEMRLCREKDDNSAEEIARLIRWIFTDPHDDAVFWGTTIQAPSGFRKNFSQMWSKMQAAGLRSVPQVESTTDYLARKGLK